MADTTTTRYGLTKPGNLEAAGAGLWGPKLNTDFDLIDSEVAFPRYPVSSPVIGATTTFDLSLGRVFALTVTQITTVAFSNVPAAGANNFSTRIRLILTNGAAFAVTWPASVTWLSAQPTLKTAGVDEIELVTKDGGTTWYASIRNGIIPIIRTITAVGTVAATIETTLHTLAVQAGAMGLNGGLRITLFYSIAGAANTKTVAIKYGGTTYGTFVFAAGETINGHALLEIMNLGAANSQLATGWYSGPTGTALSFGHTTGAVNSATALNVTVTGTTPNAADEVTAKVTMVEVIPGI